MLRDLNVTRPATLEEALRVRADLGDAGLPVAGGTDVLIQLRMHPRPGVTLIDLSRLDVLRGLSLEGGALVFGALATHADVAGSQEACAGWTALATACGEVGSPQIRARGTLAGNVANASPCADAVTALVGLGAIARVASLRGTRELPVDELIERPYRTRLQKDELITGFRVPGLGGARSAFVKLGRREALAISRINAAATVSVRDGVITRASIGVGSVMPRTERVRDAERALVGLRPDRDAARIAGELVAQRMIEVSGVRWSTPWKEPAVRAVVERAVAGAMGLGMTTDGGDR